MSEQPLDSAAPNEPTRPSDAGTPTPGQARTARTRQSLRASRDRSQRQQWRDEFPYHWRADDMVTRRDTLRFLVAGTGALFVATGALALAGSVPLAAATPTAIARVNALAPNQWRVFDFPNQYAQGILINLPGHGLVCYSDVCTHLSCAVLYDPGARQLRCPCHDGVYDAATGDVIAGPPTRPLPIIKLATRDDIIYAVQEEQR